MLRNCHGARCFFGACPIRWSHIRPMPHLQWSRTQIRDAVQQQVADLGSICLFLLRILQHILLCSYVYIYTYIHIIYYIIYIYTTSIFYAHVHICIVVAELTHSFWWHTSFLSYDRLRSLFQVISVSCFWMLRPLCEGPMQQLPNGLSFQELPAKGLEGSVRYTWLVGLRAKVALENSWITLIFAWILDGSRWYPPVK
jgi:hypothetical protein